MFLVSDGFVYQASGEDYSVEPGDTRRPFRALLDVGLVRTTTGNRVFGALKVIHIIDITLANLDIVPIKLFASIYVHVIFCELRHYIMLF